jgi:hypothetical protein
LLIDLGFSPEPPTIDKEHSKNAVTNVKTNERGQAVLTPMFAAKN